MDSGGLVDMSPTLAIDDSAYLHRAHSEAFGHPELDSAICDKASDFAHCGVGELGHSAALSAFVVGASAAFLGHVCHVVRMSTDKQVFRVDATSIVAMVTDVEIDRNLAEMQFVGEAVGLGPLPTDADASIASTLLSVPFPTLLGAEPDDVVPEVCDMIGCSSPVSMSEAHWLSSYEAAFSIALMGQCGFKSTAASAIDHARSLSQRGATMGQTWRTFAWVQV